MRDFKCVAVTEAAPRLGRYFLPAWSALIGRVTNTPCPTETGECSLPHADNVLHTEGTRSGGVLPLFEKSLVQKLRFQRTLISRSASRNQPGLLSIKTLKDTGVSIGPSHESSNRQPTP